MSKNFILMLLVAVTGFWGEIAQAAPVAINIGDFGPGAETYDFDGDAPGFGSIPTIPGATITGASGVTCESSVMCNAFWGVADQPGARQTLFFSDVMEIAFDTDLTRVGFVYGTNTGYSVSFQVLRDEVITGTFGLVGSAGDWMFHGVEDLGGIDAIRFETQGGDFHGLYDLVREAEATVPTPATFALFGLCLVGLGWSRLKKA